MNLLIDRVCNSVLYLSCGTCETDIYIFTFVYDVCINQYLNYEGGIPMIYSNTRKKTLSGWFKENNDKSFNSPLKLQKFLFLYETMSKAEGLEYDLSNLKGYERGPVFSSVWGDYTKDRSEFLSEIENSYKENKKIINESIAKWSSFMTKIYNEQELSELTHRMNIWKVKEKRINSREYQVSLSESDFIESDSEMLKKLKKNFSEDVIENSETLEIKDKIFLFSKKNYESFEAEHFDLLNELVEQHSDEIFNPIYVEIDEDGVLLVD